MNNMLKHLIPQKEKMLEYVRGGFSSSTEVVDYMVKELGYGPRRAHRIVATMVRMAREQGLKAYEVSGKLLDDAAEFADEKPPRINSKQLQGLLDPQNFIESHNNKGGTAPDEAVRMLSRRREELKSLIKEHKKRKQKIIEAEQKLKEIVTGIVKL
jgi:argininosuccinate lyase